MMTKDRNRPYREGLKGWDKPLQKLFNKADGEYQKLKDDMLAKKRRKLVERMKPKG